MQRNVFKVTEVAIECRSADNTDRGLAGSCRECNTFPLLLAFIHIRPAAWKTQRLPSSSFNSMAHLLTQGEKKLGSLCRGFNKKEGNVLLLSYYVHTRTLL
jgi:hypothetical protein